MTDEKSPAVLASLGCAALIGYLILCLSLLCGAVYLVTSIIVSVVS